MFIHLIVFKVWGKNHWTMKYRSQWTTFILWSSIQSHWLIIPRYYVNTSNYLQNIRQKSLNHEIQVTVTHFYLAKITEPWNTGHCDPLLFWGQASSHTDSLAPGIMFIHLIVFKVWGKNHWIMKYRSQWHTFILRSNTKSYWLIIPRYYVYTSNSLQDITVRQNHWTMKHRSQWPTFILRSSIKSYWLIRPRYHVYTSNNLQDIRQNHLTMKYRSQWPTFILRSGMKSYWLITPRYQVYTSNSLQNIMQNPWTIKYRSEWPTFISTLFSVSDLDLRLAAEWCQLFCNHTEVTLIKHQQPR